MFRQILLAQLCKTVRQDLCVTVLLAMLVLQSRFYGGNNAVTPYTGEAAYKIGGPVSGFTVWYGGNYYG